MHGRMRWTRLIGLLALLVGLLGMVLAAPPATGQGGTSSITVHNRICPVEYEGTSWFADCHDTAPDPGLPFTFVNEDSGEVYDGTTNEDGDIGFANLSAGTWTITGGAPGEFADRFVYCSIGTAETSDQEPVELTQVQGGVQFELPDDTNVICDWYQVPYDLQGEASPTATTPERFDMPVFTLLCETDPGVAVTDFVMGGVMPDGCEGYAGAVVTISTPEGDIYGTCETEGVDPCFVNVDIGGTVVATIDPATLPAGYTVVGGETQQVEVPPASEAWTLFVAVPTEPAPTETPAPTEVPLPPVEGRTVTIHAGTCAPGEAGAVVAELTDLTGPESGLDMEADVMVAETSSSVVNLALSDIMAEEHALIAYTDDEVETPVACTALDGELNDNGELVLGLREVNDSGFAGIVYLVPADDGNQTRISVFLAEGLAEDASDMATPSPSPVG